MMIVRLETPSIEVEPGTSDGEAKPLCCHYWIIEPPNGSSSRGVCKFCGEERDFNNSVERYFIKKRGAPRYKPLPVQY